MSVDHPPPEDRPRLHAVPRDEDIPYDPYYDGTPEQRRGPTVPNDRAAEQAILAALLTDPQAHEKITGQLRPADFYQPIHEHIWTAYHHILDTTGTPPDRIILTAHLLKTKQLDAVRALAALELDTVTPAHIGHYADIVRDHARMRAIQRASTALQQLATSGDTTRVDATLGEALQLLDDADLRSIPGTHDTTRTGRHDLAWVLTGQAPTQPPPAYTHRTDGVALFYKAKVNGVFGDPESGKTWLAQTAIVEALQTGGTAAMIDVDHNGANHTAARLLLLGAPPNAIADPNQFRYYEPEEHAELLAAVDEITGWAPDVYVLDSLGEVLPMMGVKSVDNDEITSAVRRTCSPPAVAGSCVITIDHLPKGVDARASGYAIGGTAKKRMMRGSYLRVETRTQLAPGAIGRSTIRIEKDTSGELRKHTPGGLAGTLVIDSTTAGTTEWRVEMNTAPLDRATHEKRYTHVMERISRYVEDNDQATGGDLKRALGGNDDIRKKAIQTLVNENYLTILPGARGAELHHSIAHYREADDDHLDTND